MELELDREVRPSQLEEELSGKLGREVRLSVRQPGQKDAGGADLPGVVVVIDARTGKPMEGKSADFKAAQKVLLAHEPKPVEKAPSRDELAVAALQAAETLDEVKAALIARFAPAERPQRGRRAR